NQANGVSRYRLLLLEDKSGFPRKAAMNLFFAYDSGNFSSATPERKKPPKPRAFITSSYGAFHDAY
ncbi:hypothetical protein AB4559_00455, partial [Vibrio sp. 10N.222.51.C8]